LVTNLKVFIRCFIVLTGILFFLKKSFNPKEFLQSIAIPFLAVSSWGKRKIDTVLLRTEPRENLIKICRELANENLALQLEIQRDQDLRDRLKYLEELVALGERIVHKKVYARVIGREASAWFESIIVNKGYKHGISLNALALAGKYIIGKVIEVSEQFSVIALASSPKFRLAVLSEKFSMPMVFTGNGSDLCKNDGGKIELVASGTIKNIPSSAQKNLQNGSKITAASLTTTDFDLPLGFIGELHSQADGMFLQATIALPEIINNLQEILIIIPDDPQKTI
jgi:rod shape-determining protein MreC